MLIAERQTLKLGLAYQNGLRPMEVDCILCDLILTERQTLKLNMLSLTKWAERYGS